jgi:formylglycine-generating enzyme required for sulfatase activity
MKSCVASAPRAPDATLPPRQSAVNRADLLWLLQRTPADEAREVAALLGFCRVEPDEPVEPVKQRVKPVPAGQAKPTRDEAPPAGARPRLRASHFAVIEHQRYPAEDSRRRDEGEHGDPGHGDGEIFASLQGDPDHSAPPHIPLSPPSRLSVFLRRSLRTPRPGPQVDLSRLIDQLARVRLPRHLPRQNRPRWSRDAALIVDLSLAAWPLRDDLIELAEQAHALSAGRLPVLCRDSTRSWSRRLPGREVAWATVDEAALFEVRHWLIAGDAGSLSADPENRRYWRTRCQGQRARGGELTLLTGDADREWTRRLPRQARLVAWEHGRRLLAARQPGPTTADDRQRDAASQRLLAALSLAVVVEPGLLREIRLALGVSMAGELAVWNHPHSEHCILGMQIRREHLADYRRQLLAELSAAQRRRVAEIIATHHAGHYRAIRCEEAALAAELAGFEVEQALADWARALRTLRRKPGGDAAREFTSYLGRTGLRAHASLWQAIPDLADAYVIARREALQNGAAIPLGLPGSSLERHLGTPGPAGAARRWWLVQNEAGLAGTALPLQPGQFLLAECEPAQGFDLQTPQHGRQWHALPGAGRALATLQADGGPWIVRSAREKLVVAEVPRPSWARAWGRDRRGLYAVPPSLPGLAVKLYWQPWTDEEAEALTWPPPARGFSSPRQQIAEGVWQGADLDYGLYLDLEFPGGAGVAGIVQRFRWIEPGEFWMGSPDDEAGRDSDEGPRHRVRLTAGYWLADTACTQALWQAVMGENPSHFKDDPMKPVEQVSWDDVQAFLERAQAMLSGVALELPTEAEWEYACRAGTETPFSFGATISPALANYDGNHPYGGAEKGLYREKTVPVKSFAPNPWGLYEMHGNVWEWCADGQRQYAGEPHENPRGSEALEDDAPRVLRGGSWSGHAGWLRSAYRGRGQRGDRLVSDGQGFRFSLRSTGQAAGAERLQQRHMPEKPAGPKVLSTGPKRIGSAVSDFSEADRRGFSKGRQGTGSSLAASSEKK